MLEGFGIEETDLITGREALDQYQAWLNNEPPSTPLEQALIDNAVATVPVPVSRGSFREFDQLFDELIADSPPELAHTSHKVDQRFGFDAGYVRKEMKLNEQGQQTYDAKSLFHFNEFARLRWESQFTAAEGNRPKSLDDYLAVGYELHHELLQSALGNIALLSSSHPNIDHIYAPTVAGKVVTMSFMRHIAYDGYDSASTIGDVARPHYDISGWTFQEYADAEGFWGSQLPDGVRMGHSAPEGFAHMFAGVAHSLLYEEKSPIRPLWHGADRNRPVHSAFVPVRHATILFVDAPFVDLGIGPEHTSPHLYE